MRINMAIWDKVIRLIIGVAMLGWAIAGGPPWTYLGLVFIATASWRFCPVYALFRTGTYR